MMHGRHPILALFAILLLLQGWVDVWVDALTQSHYWHTERQQFEHASSKAKPIAFEGFSKDTLNCQRTPWAEDPCPVPSFLNNNSASPEGIAICVDIFNVCEDINIPLSLFTHGYSILLYAPKQSPPIV